MRLSATLGTLVVAVALTATSFPGPAAGGRSSPSPAPDPYLDAFRCNADAAHLVSVTWDGDTYRGVVNWVPEHFVAPAGAPWTVDYADGVVRLVAQGMYLPLPGQLFVRGTLELTAFVAEQPPTVSRTGVGPGSGDSNHQQVHLEIRRTVDVVGPARIVFDNGHAYDVIGCTGSVVSRIVDKNSDPRAFIATGTHAGGWCDPIETGSRIDELAIDTFGATWWFTLSAYDDRGTPDDPDDDTWAFYGGDSGASSAAGLDGLTFEVAGESWPPPPGGGEARAAIRLSWHDLTTSRFELNSGTWTNYSSVTSGPLTATVEYDDSSSVEFACLAYSDTYRHVEGGGSAPGSARPPANDRPAGAVPLTGATTVQTGGTALEAEEPNPCTTPWDESDYRATHTVWFTFTGSGHTVIDTDGTRFDTAIAVYTEDGTGALEPLDGACSDDERFELNPGLFGLDLQARATFVADPATMYYVQVGGVSSDANYGALRVSVGSP